MVQCVFTTVVRTAEWEGPCIIIMSSANVTISRFGVVFSSTIRSLIIMFHSVGPETDPCGSSGVAFRACCFALFDVIVSVL